MANKFYVIGGMEATKTFHLTVTANLADATEINDIEISETVSADDIGTRSWAVAKDAVTAAALDAGKAPPAITSLVIVAVAA